MPLCHRIWSKIPRGVGMGGILMVKKILCVWSNFGRMLLGLICSYSFLKWKSLIRLIIRFIEKNDQKQAWISIELFVLRIWEMTYSIRIKKVILTTFGISIIYFTFL
jgi:hypothetical protein